MANEMVIWPDIAKAIQGREGRMCFNRFRNQLDPVNKLEPFSEDEEIAIYILRNYNKFEKA